VLLGAFSVILVGIRLKGERRVTCGCFGGSDDVDIGAALARNAVLGAIALVSIGRPDAPRLGWPLMPAGADVVPAALVAVGLGAAIAIAVGTARALRRTT
jgi:hypothetical protein